MDPPSTPRTAASPLAVTLDASPGLGNSRENSDTEGARCGCVALVEGSAPELTAETQRMLRVRLRMAAVVLFVGLLLLLVLSPVLAVVALARASRAERRLDEIALRLGALERARSRAGAASMPSAAATGESPPPAALTSRATTVAMGSGKVSGNAMVTWPSWTFISRSPPPSRRAAFSASPSSFGRRTFPS